MGYREIFDRIDAGRMEGMLIFHGPEEYSKDRALERLKARYLPKGLEELNCQFLEDEHANAVEIRRAAETLPFMAEKRLVVVRDYPMLAASSRGSGLNEASELEEMDRLIPNFPKTTCLVFFQRVPPDKRRAAWTRIIKAAESVEFVFLTEDELTQQLGKMAKRSGCSVSVGAARFMMQYCGNDLEALSHEMEKACAHAGEGSAVTRADIEAVCVQTMESKVFDFIDLLFAGNAAAVMEKLRALAGDDDGAAGLLSLVGRQARLMAAVKAEGPNANSGAVASIFGVRPFVMDIAKRQAARWTGGELCRIIALCAGADESVKQGRAEMRSAVERVIMEIVHTFERKQGKR
jgi:DNA polymerase-3 subunit delta